MLLYILIIIYLLNINDGKNIDQEFPGIGYTTIVLLISNISNY